MIDKTFHMQKYIVNTGTRLLCVAILLLPAFMVRAQDQIEIDKEEIGSWFERNWIWVAAGVLLIVLIALMGRGKAGSRKTTTVVKDPQGHTKSVTTTEEKF
jgi:protein-S-isoprenylcysteine O-methyltransferase Ste14